MTNKQRNAAYQKTLRAILDRADVLDAEAIEKIQDLIGALQKSIVGRLEDELSKGNAYSDGRWGLHLDEAAWKAANPQYCPSEDGPEAIEAWRSRYCLPPYCRAYNALSCMAQETDRRKRCWCKEDAEGQLAK